MARSSQYVKVGKRTVELSNLKKVLWPDDEFVKAELIEYYLKLAPTILSHIKGRPLSVVRYPNGVNGESFFQKNRPDWAPDWMDHAALGDKVKKVDYMIATEDASLVFLANLACIELHQMHSRSPRFDKPDYFVVDFDPPEGFPFATTRSLAFEYKEHLEQFGYHTFVKTTGKKGLHVLAPIERRRLRQPRHSVLGRGVGGRVGPWRVGRDRAVVDDAAPARVLALHDLEGGLYRCCVHAYAMGAVGAIHGHFGAAGIHIGVRCADDD